MQDKGKKLIIFDMDGVLTQHSSSWQYIHTRIGVDNSRNYELFKSRKIGYEEFLESDVRLWTASRGKLTVEDIKSMLYEIPLRNNLRKSMELLRRRNATLAIVSGGISWLSDRINSIFRFDYTYSNSIKTDEEGLILPSGVTQVDPLRKDLVVRKLQEDTSLGPEDTISVGDSVQDIPMFRLSSFSVGFNPVDEEVSRNSEFSMSSNDLFQLAELIEKQCLV